MKNIFNFLFNRTHKENNYGYIKDLPDLRDYTTTGHNTFGLSNSNVTKVDLSNLFPPVYDQAGLGACVPNSLASVIEFLQNKEKITQYTPSRLFIYYNTRVIDGTVKSDSGCTFRNCIKSYNDLGSPPENYWLYMPFRFTTKPSKKAYDEGLKHKELRYVKISQDLDSLKAVLTSGYPFVFGMVCYQSFESKEVASTGNVPLPKKDEKPTKGHAGVCVGFDDATKQFLCRNSWGSKWGKKGYYTLPYEYMINSNLTGDHWMITHSN